MSEKMTDARAIEILTAVCDGGVGSDNSKVTFVDLHEARDHIASRLVQQPITQEVIPAALSEIARKMRRFAEVCEDSDADGVDISREWLDALTTIGLLERSRRSPALWGLTSAGESLVEPAPNFAACCAEGGGSIAGCDCVRKHHVRVNFSAQQPIAQEANPFVPILSQTFARGRLEGLSIATAECDRLTTALDYGGNEYRRPAPSDQCARSLRSIYAQFFRGLYPDPASLNEPSGIAGQLQEAASGPVAAQSPIGYCDPSDPFSRSAFSWPGTDREPRHSMPLYAAPPAQQADPWRGLYSPDRMPSDKDEPTHPDLPSYDDDREDSIAPLLKAQGFEWKTITTEFDESVGPNDDAYWQILRGWVPEPPDASYRLAGKYDTEDGPSALFVRPIASPGAQGGE